MRNIILTLAVLAALTGTAYAETIKASVNGLVCAFCATSIEKTFKAQPAVDTVQVDLETKLVTITTREGQNIDDALITKLIEDAGYTVTDIKRGEGNAPAQ